MADFMLSMFLHSPNYNFYVESEIIHSETSLIGPEKENALPKNTEPGQCPARAGEGTEEGHGSHDTTQPVSPGQQRELPRGTRLLQHLKRSKK